MGADRDRNPHGQYADAIPPETVLKVFNAREDLARPVTANDVTEALGIARRTAHNKLNQLVERGALETRKVGARGRVWWVPIREGSESGVAGAEERTDTAEASDSTPEHERDPAGETRASRGAPDPVEGLELPGSGDRLEARREALRTMYQYLKEHGAVRRSEFKEVVNVAPTGYADFNSFYTNCIKNGAVLAELPGVRSPGEGGHTYTYAREES